MKLASIFVQNLLGAQAVELALDRPVNLIAGGNAQGKSSIGDAVRLAMCADLGRVETKTHAASLVTDGADSAVAEVVLADGETYRVAVTKAGKITDSHKGRDHDPRLPFVLDGQRVAKMSPADRRAFLATVAGFTIDHATVKKHLISKGLDAERVERIAPLLRMGFDQALKDAKDRATQAKGAWRAVTGENWGSVKAEKWVADLPAFNPAELAAMEEALARTEAQISEAQQALGALEGNFSRAARDAAQLDAALKLAELAERRRTKLALDEAELVKWQDVLRNTEAQAGTAPREGLVHDLARSLIAVVNANPNLDAELVNGASDVLDAYEALHGPIAGGESDPAALERLPGLRSTVAMCTRTVEASRRDVAESEGAAAHVEALKKSVGESAPPTIEAVQQARDHLGGLQGLRATRAKTLQDLRTVKAAADSAEQKTAKAREHHADVVAWDNIATELSPEGVQAELLRAALQPLNDRLAQSAADLGWKVATVHADMTITAEARPYALLSKSEQWRVDAMLAETIAYLSGLKLLVLDGMDILSLPGRGQLLGWLDMLTQNGEVDTVLVMATLKALPTSLPDTMSAHWIESGVSKSAQLAEAA